MGKQSIRDKCAACGDNGPTVRGTSYCVRCRRIVARASEAKRYWTERGFPSTGEVGWWDTMNEIPGWFDKHKNDARALKAQALARPSFPFSPLPKEAKHV